MSLAQVLLGAAAKTKVSPRFAPFFSQAANEALVRFGPQWDVLNLAREESARSMRQRVQQANIAGAMIADAANRSAGTLANAPAPTVNYASPNAGSSSQVVAQNLGQTRESTLGMLTTAARNAPIMASQQGLQARTSHEQDLAKIQGQRASLAAQIGAYTTGRIDDLIGSDRKLRHDANQAAAKLKASFVQAGVDPTTGQVVKGGPKDPNVTHPNRGPSNVAKPPSNFTGSPADWNNLSRSERDAWVSQHPTSRSGGADSSFQNKYGVKPASQPRVEHATNEIGRAITIAKTHKQQGDPRNVTAGTLIQGVPSFTSGQQKIPATPAVQQLFARAALDIVYDGHVSGRTATLLHKAGYSVAQLGLPATTKRTPSIGTGVGGSIPLPPGVQS